MKIHLTDNNFNKSSAVAEMGDHLATIDMSSIGSLVLGHQPITGLHFDD